MNQPYLQGYLDYYCGLYSIANSLRKITDRSFNKHQPKIFARLVEKLVDLKAIYNIERNGIASSTMQKLFPCLKRILHSDYDISIEVSQPFSNEYINLALAQIINLEYYAIMQLRWRLSKYKVKKNIRVFLC